MTETLDLQNRYLQTLDKIRGWETRYGRTPHSVRLIAVSKRHATDKILEIAKAGQSHFAENFLQEGIEKIARLTPILSQIKKPIEWHFIGHIQSRKSKLIAQHFDWVHTIDRIEVAEKLNQHRKDRPPLKVLIQVNLQHEAHKSGVSREQVNTLALQIRPLSQLKLCGLMILPRPENKFDRQRAVFKECRELLQQLNQQGFELDQLSMGMTNDMEAAIAEGSTQVRIGTAIFGQRDR